MNPSCGPCLGGHTGLIGPEEVSLSTSNRNFKDVKGVQKVRFIYHHQLLPRSAIEGRITKPEWKL